MAYLGQASQNEGGSFAGGSPGDQTGREVYMRTYYNYPWNVFLEPVDTNFGHRIANNMITACNNANIGYSQNTRNTCKDVNAIYKCNTDCSALVSLCVTQAGCDILKGRSNAPTTSTLRSVLLATGKFRIVGIPTKRGTVLLREGNHTAIYLGADTNKHSGDTPAPQPTQRKGEDNMFFTFQVDGKPTVYFCNNMREVIALNDGDELKELREIYKTCNGRDLSHKNYSSNAPFYNRLMQVMGYGNGNWKACQKVKSFI